MIRKYYIIAVARRSKRTITVYTLAKHLPNHLISYIIYHEICHIIEARHDKAFWECIKKHYPDHRKLEKELLAYEVRLGLHSPMETS